MVQFSKGRRIEDEPVEGRRGVVVKVVKVVNETSGKVILAEADLAERFGHRLKGLLGKKALAPGQGMVIRPCRSIHTVGMAFAIDVGFVDAQGCLCRVVEDLPPGKVGVGAREARYVIEAPAGTFAAAGVQQGDRVALEDLEDLEGNGP